MHKSLRGSAASHRALGCQRPPREARGETVPLAYFRVVGAMADHNFVGFDGYDNLTAALYVWVATKPPLYFNAWQPGVYRIHHFYRWRRDPTLPPTGVEYVAILSGLRIPQKATKSAVAEVGRSNPALRLHYTLYLGYAGAALVLCQYYESTALVLHCDHTATAQPTVLVLHWCRLGTAWVLLWYYTHPGLVLHWYYTGALMAERW